MRFTLLSLFTMLALSASAQLINYKIEEADPELAFTKFIAPEYGAMGGSTTIGMYLGAQARVGITEALTIEGYGRYDVWTISGEGPQYTVDAALFLPLKKGSKTKDVPVILSYNPYAGTEFKDGNLYNVEETRSITIPNGKYNTQLGARAGVHVSSVGVGNPGLGPEGVISHAGVYVGGQMTAKTLIKALINDDVYRYGAGFSRTYLDVLVLPSNNLSEPTATADTRKDGLIGWRAGLQWYVSPHDGEYRFLGRSVISLEVGQRPISGWNLSMGWGLAFAEKR
jgi:hypothetical protein